MPFLGNQPQQGFANSVVKDNFTPNGSTTAFTLSKSAASANDIEVYVGNVRQEPTDAYTVSGTTLTMSEAPAIGMNFYVMHVQGTVESTIAPQANSVGVSQLQNSAVTDAKIAGMAASKLTGALPAISGASLTGIESFTRATIDFGSSVYSFTGLPSTTEIIHVVITNGQSTGDIRVRLRAGGNIVSSNNFTGLDYRYTNGAQNWAVGGGSAYTTGIAQLGSWGASTLHNAILTILRNHSSSDSNPSFHCSGLVFYRNYGTHGGLGKMIGLNTGLGAAFDGVAFASSNSITAGKATIYYR